jgi:site-specific recombinase XerD
MKFIHKIKVKYRDDERCGAIYLPALYTDKGLLISHLRYLAQNFSKSASWKERSVFSIRLLINYINEVQSFNKATDLLRSFTNALVTGTIDYEKLSDPLGLYWKARSITDANNILFHINRYTDYLATQEGYKFSRINPFRKATSYEERLNWCSYYNKHANVFLNHLSKRNDAYLKNRRVREVNGFPVPKIEQEKVIKFPDDKLDKLLYFGFSRKKSFDYKSQAITMLLNYGGLRKSEVFHLFVSDITLHPNRPGEGLVRVYHPEYGTSPDRDFKNRSSYLLESTTYKPRTHYRISEGLYSGWKDPLLTSKNYFFEVMFNPAEKAVEFLNVWAKYLKYQRVEPPISEPHPFAFTNSKGRPETIKNFQRIHKRAVEKIGLRSKKEIGTTEHGHRHAYGYRCRKSGLTQVEIQKAMHHKSPMSCLVYISPTSEDLREAMRKLE